MTDFYFGMIWSHAKSHESKGRRQSFIHVYASIWLLLEQSMCSIEACWPRADDGTS